MPNPYLHVLRTPHAVPMVVAAFIGRLPLSMVGLGSVLLVQAETGSYGLGGAVAAVGAVATAAAGPVIGRLADTLAQRRVLLAVVAVFVGAGVVFLFSVREDWPLWQAAERRDATARYAARTPVPASQTQRTLPQWPFAVLFALAMLALWWRERR